MDFICFSDISLIIFHDKPVDVKGDDNTSEEIVVEDLIPLGCSSESVVYVSDFNN